MHSLTKHSSLTGQSTSSIICSGQTCGFFFVFSAANALNSSNSLSQLSANNNTNALNSSNSLSQLSANNNTKQLNYSVLIRHSMGDFTFWQLSLPRPKLNLKTHFGVSPMLRLTNFAECKLVNRDVRNRFFYFSSVSVQFLKKTQIWFRQSLVGFKKCGSVQIL